MKPPRKSAPQFEFSRIGRKLTARSGILELMDDLGRAMTTEPHLRMLGGGNPAVVPEMQALLRQRMRELLDNGETFDRMLCNYEPPQGNPRFRSALAELQNAISQAGEMLSSNCPTYRPLTPVVRLDAMEQRLDAMLRAVEKVQPALSRFYGSLTDEQKERFNRLPPSQS